MRVGPEIWTTKAAKGTKRTALQKAPEAVFRCVAMKKLSCRHRSARLVPLVALVFKKYRTNRLAPVLAETVTSICNQIVQLTQFERNSRYCRTAGFQDGAISIGSSIEIAVSAQADRPQCKA